MTLMAGFDFVAEISNETLLKLIENNLKFGGVSVSPPFELTLPLQSGPVSGAAHLIVTDLQVDLNADDTITLTLSFDRASIVSTAPLALTVCPLDGNFAITAPIQLVNIGGSNEQVSVNLAAAKVTVVWSLAAKQEIAQDLAGTPLLTPDNFTSLTTQMLTSYVQSIPAPALPIGFPVVAGMNGSLVPPLTFEKLEIHCIPNVQRSKQALGIFGILLVANHANGDHSQKTSTAITEAHDGICISIAPGAFHSLLFCRAIASAFGTDPADLSTLPTSCGAAASFDTHGVSVNSLSDSFAAGHIDINGSVSKSGFCYDATGAFHGTLTFSISSGVLTPNLLPDKPTVDVEIPWYCWVVPAVVLGPIGFAVTGIFDAVTHSVAITADMVKNALSGGLSGVSVGGLPGTLLTGAPISTEGISLQGTVPLFVPHPFVVPALNLSGSAMTTQSQTLSSGTFHAQVWCLPQAKDYPYTEFSQQQSGVYQLSGAMVSEPLTPHYSVGSNGVPIPLVGANGTVALPNVDTQYPMPLATGGTAMQQTVHVSYEISGTSITLTNVPSEGDYGFRLYVTATDCKGNPVQDDAGNALTTWIDVQFEGDHVDIGGGYAADVQHCAQQLWSWLNGLHIVAGKIPLWPPVNYPPPESLIEYMRDLVALGAPQADEILVASKIAHGNSFYRALSSLATTQAGLPEKQL
jgi:hypothetical protein